MFYKIMLIFIFQNKIDDKRLEQVRDMTRHILDVRLFSFSKIPVTS